MADDMSDGLVNIIEQKVLKNMASQNIGFNGPLQDKIDAILSGQFRPDMTNWDQIQFDQSYL